MPVKNENHPGGWSRHKCPDCRKIKNERARKLYRDSERYRFQKESYRKKNRDKNIKYQKQYYKEKRIELQNKQKIYQEKNSEYFNSYQKQYNQQSNPPNARSGEWTDEETRALIENVGSFTIIQLAFLLQRKIASVRDKIRRLRKAGLL